MNKPPEGRCHPAQKPGGGPGQDVQRPPGPGAEQKKISRCPQQQAQGHVQPPVSYTHLTLPTTPYV